MRRMIDFAGRHLTTSTVIRLNLGDFVKRVLINDIFNFILRKVLDRVRDWLWRI